MQYNPPSITANYNHMNIIIIKTKTLKLLSSWMIIIPELIINYHLSVLSTDIRIA